MRPLAVLAALSLLAGCRQATAPTIEAPQALAVSPVPTLRDVRVEEHDGAIVVSAKADPRVLAQLGVTWTFEIVGVPDFSGFNVFVFGPGLSRSITPDVGPTETRTSTRTSLVAWVGDSFLEGSTLTIRGATLAATMPLAMVRADYLAVYSAVERGPTAQVFVLDPTHGHGIDDPEFPAEDPVAMRRP